MSKAWQRNRAELGREELGERKRGDAGSCWAGEDGSLRKDVVSFQFTGDGTEETKSRRGGGVERNEKTRFIQ